MSDSEEKAVVKSPIRGATPGTSDEMAAFSSSNEAAYSTGQGLFIEGGLTLYGDFREVGSAWLP